MKLQSGFLIASLMVAAVLFPHPAAAEPKGSHEFFVVNAPDGREEMRFSCNGGENVNEIECDIRSTKFVVPDPGTKTQVASLSERLAAGNDSLRNALCKSLQLIDPNVKETKEIVDLLRSACKDSDGKRLALAYAKMDTLSKATCIILNREELLKFTRAEKNTWVYQAAKVNACLDSKRYVIRAAPDSDRRSVEKTFVYSDSKAIACAEEKYIEMNSALKQLSDGHIVVPPQCRYMYLQ